MVSPMHAFLSRREFLEAAALSSAISLKGSGAPQNEDASSPTQGRWRLPLRVTERAGVSWQGEHISVGAVVPPSCSAVAVRLKNEQTGELIPSAAGYGARTTSGRLRWFQLSMPLYLAPGFTEHLMVELLDDSGAPGAVVPNPVGMESIPELDLGTTAGGIRWSSDPAYGV